MHVHFKRRLMVLAGMGSWLPLAQAKQANPPAILILGDSLSAEYGLPLGKGWVALLEQRLQREQTNARVVNASISGETTFGGRNRLSTLLTQHRPRWVVIELGANDALRGLPIKSTRENLSAMIAASQTQRAKVILIGMQLPPNFGKRYAEDFARLYQEVADAHGCALVPFFLRGVADQPDARKWFQPDGIHPTDSAHPIMLDNVWRVLKPLLLGRESRT